MTKIREPLSVADAITEIAKTVGWEETAAIVGLTVRTIAYWSDPEDPREPKLSQALALDAAYRAETKGDYAPIQAAYAYQLDVLQAPVGNRDQLRQIVGDIIKETGEAACAVLHATDNPHPNAQQNAVRELDEASEVICRARAALGAPLLKVVGQ